MCPNKDAHASWGPNDTCTGAAGGVVPYPERQPTERGPPTPPPGKRTELSLRVTWQGIQRTSSPASGNSAGWGEVHSFPQITPLWAPQDHQHSRACHRGSANNQLEWEARAVQVNKGKSLFSPCSPSQGTWKGGEEKHKNQRSRLEPVQREARRQDLYRIWDPRVKLGCI